MRFATPTQVTCAARLAPAPACFTSEGRVGEEGNAPPFSGCKPGAFLLDDSPLL